MTGGTRVPAAHHANDDGTMLWHTTTCYATMGPPSQHMYTFPLHTNDDEEQ